MNLANSVLKIEKFIPIPNIQSSEIGDWCFDNWGSPCDIEYSTNLKVDEIKYRCIFNMLELIDVFADRLSNMFPNLYIRLDASHHTGVYSFLFYNDTVIEINNETTGLYELSHNGILLVDFTSVDYNLFFTDPIKYSEEIDLIIYEIEKKI